MSPAPDPIAALAARLRAQRKGYVLPDRYRPRPNFDHLDDPDLLRRLTADVEGDDCEVMEVVKAKRRRAARKQTLSSVAKEAAKAGIEVKQYDIDPATGKISVILGKPEPATTITVPQIDANEWN